MDKVLGGVEGTFLRLREQGRVTFQDLQKAIINVTTGTGRFAGMGEEYAETYAGKIDKLADSWDDLKRYAGQAVIDEMSLKTGADDAGTFVDSLKPFVDLLRPAIKWVGELGRGLAQMAAEGGKAFLDIADILMNKLGRAFPQTVQWIKEMVGGMKGFKLTPEGIAGFAVSLGDGIIGALKAVKPHWDSFINDFVVPLRDALMLIPNALKAIDRNYSFVKEMVKEGRAGFSTR